VLQDILTNVVQDHARERSVQLNLELNPEPLAIRADDEQLTRALANVIGNAMNMSRAHETIKVRAYPVLPLYAVCEIEHGRENVDDEHPSVVFHPFSRPSQGHITHTGLELSIARSIIKLHGGDIALIVNEDGISVFTIRLKLAAAEE